MNADEAKDPLTQRIIAAAFEVANTLGHGFAEVVYQRAMAVELGRSGLAVGREVPFTVVYKGEEVGNYVADLVVEGAVVVELKSVESLAATHVGQCLNYLRVSGLKTGLVLNFGRPKLEIRRVSL